MRLLNYAADDFLALHAGLPHDAGDNAADGIHFLFPISVFAKFLEDVAGNHQIVHNPRP